MQEIGLFDAKTNLSKIAEQVKLTGQAVTLTKRGQPYVDLVPHQPAAVQRRPKSEVLNDLEKLRQSLPKSSLDDILADIREGRR